MSADSARVALLYSSPSLIVGSMAVLPAGRLKLLVPYEPRSSFSFRRAALRHSVPSSPIAHEPYAALLPSQVPY